MISNLDKENEFVTTNLRLRKRRLQELKLIALSEGESLAELIRQAIDAYLGYSKKRKGKHRDIDDFKKDPFFEVVGLSNDTVTDGSVHHDYYIYGKTFKKK